MNQFLKAVNSYDAYTENGAVSHSTTGDNLLDYFSKCGSHRDRDLSDVYADVSKILAESPKIALQILFYLRTITRKHHDITDTVQRGQGNRDEFRKAMSWIAKHRPELFNKNMWLIPQVGCWKDLFHKDLEPFINKDELIALIRKGLADEYHATLLAKYLPKIRSKRNTHNDEHVRKNELARAICRELGWSERDYRHFKRSGKSHQFQRDMCNGNWAGLDFSRIPGKALLSLATTKGRDGLTTLERHKIEDSYAEWLESQPVAKFNGYPYELLKKFCNGYSVQNLSRVSKLTIDRQFDNLIKTAKKDAEGITGNVWCAIDTSASMSALVTPGLSAYQICVALGVYFSSLNEGAFKDNVIMFDKRSRKLQLRGSFVDKVTQIVTTNTAWGNTNFQSVIDEIVRVRKNNPNIPIEDYPETLLVVSDMQFDPSCDNKTNYESAMDKLQAVGLPKIKVIWWYVTSRGKDFPAKLDDEGCTLIGGFDGAIVSSILGGEVTTIDEDTGEERALNPYENMLKALNQDSLNMVQI